MSKDYIFPISNIEQTSLVRDLIISENSCDRSVGRCIAILKHPFINWLDGEESIAESDRQSISLSVAQTKMMIGLAKFQSPNDKSYHDTLITLKHIINSLIDKEIISTEEILNAESKPESG